MTSTATDIEEYLNDVDPYEFEKFVAGIWEGYGWETSVSSGSQDRGIDIVASKDKPVQQTHLIQAKAYSDENKLGSEEVRRYATLHQQEHEADSVVIVTTGQFTSQAQELAGDLDVKTVDWDELVDLLIDIDFEDFDDIKLSSAELNVTRDYSLFDSLEENEYLSVIEGPQRYSGFDTCPACKELKDLWEVKLENQSKERVRWIKCEECGFTLTDSSGQENKWGIKNKGNSVSIDKSTIDERRTLKEWRETSL